MKFLVIFFISFAALAYGDLLPSWNEGHAKFKILDFIKKTTADNSKDFIPISERIAVFDQDGTLWVEKPICTQFFFAFDRIVALFPRHPEWENEEPYSWILNKDFEKIKTLGIQDIEKVIAETHSNMSVEKFLQIVNIWLATARHPKYKKPYTKLVYQPMLELIDLFIKNQFRVYIVSGSGQEFIRAYSEKVYGIPQEQVIGTAAKTKYEYKDGKPELIKLPSVLFIDDKNGKPEAINLAIGKRPVAALGNSDGDREMLEWTQASKTLHLELLVHHDDPIREYAYDENSKVGTFSAALMQEAKNNDWIVVSMKNDWKVIFPDD